LFAMFQPDKYWPAFCRALSLENLADDPRFSDLKLREQNSAALVSILDKAFAKHTRDEWLDILAKEDLVYSPIKDYLEVINDPQVLENEYIIEYEHPSLGKLKTIGTPAMFRETPGKIREPAPQLGQHTEEVLIDVLGYSWEDIEKIRDRGVIL
ncbi:CoA transferase, partial [Thermodesulfobacteriota bacterium]